MSATYPGAFSGGLPNLFTSPMGPYPSRSLFASAERVGSEGPNVSFTQEDRLMLQLLYQQQQAIQIQLQSVALSMHQLHMVVAGIVKQPPTPMSVFGGLPGEANMSANASMHTARPTVPVESAPNAAVAPVADPFPNVPADALQRAALHNASATAAHHSPHESHPKESLRSCTPPPEDLDGSRQSALMNQSLGSAAPWDPSAGGSRHSSATRVTRERENPLLSSLRGKLPTPSRSSASACTAYSASANVSASLDDSRPTVRPTVHPSSSSSLHMDPAGHGGFSSRPTRQSKEKQQQQQQQRQQRIVLDSRRGEATAPAPQRSSSAAAVAMRTGSGGQEELKATRRPALNDEYGVTSVSAIGYDSQSDGYGSYETRQYLKSVGIIQR